MAQEPVHYEVFIRRDVQASWALDMATETRAHAVEAAEEALKHGRAIGVKVSKESQLFNGEYQSLVVFSRGELQPPRKSRMEDESPAPLCVGPADLYTAHGRERIGRLFEGWLRRQAATPFELLHRPDLVERLEATGLEIQHAIQKVAIPEAKASGQSTHETIRRFQRLADATVARLLGDARRDLFPDLEKDSLAGCLQRAAEASDPAYVLGAAVARRLSREVGWVAKVERLLDLLDDCGDQAGRTLLLHVVEQPLAEILGGQAVLAELLGSSADLGRQLALIARLVTPDVAEALSLRDPELAGVVPPVGPEVARLARWLCDPALLPVAVALARRVLGELHGPRRLHASDPAAEIATLRALARLLVMSPHVVSPEAVQEAFIARSRRMVGADFVESYLAACKGGAIEEALGLLRLTENVAGAANKRAAGAWLKSALNALRFERELRTDSHSPLQKLAQLADLQRAVTRVGLDPGDEAELAARLGELADLVETEAKLLAAIVRSPASAAQRLELLLRLASGDGAAVGPVTRRARAEALKLMRDPSVRAGLAGGAPRAPERMRALLQTSQAAA